MSDSHDYHSPYHCLACNETARKIEKDFIDKIPPGQLFKYIDLQKLLYPQRKITAEDIASYPSWLPK